MNVTHPWDKGEGVAGLGSLLWGVREAKDKWRELLVLFSFIDAFKFTEGVDVWFRARAPMCLTVSKACLISDTCCVTSIKYVATLLSSS